MLLNRNLYNRKNFKTESRFTVLEKFTKMTLMKKMTRSLELLRIGDISILNIVTYTKVDEVVGQTACNCLRIFIPKF